jgi:glucokinase
MLSKIEMDKVILAVDIGGTKTAAGVITTDGRILNRVTEPTLQNGPEAGIHQIIALIESLFQQSKLNPEQFIGVGVGIPAVLEDNTDLVIWGPNLIGWENVNLRGSLETHFKLPVNLEYDGHSAVLGEWWMGAGRGHRYIVNIIIGTGVGGGMILDGRLVRGINRLAGAVGWFAFDPTYVPSESYANRLGSWEARIAGPGIAERARKLVEEQAKFGAKNSKLSENPDAREVFTLAKQGDPLAQKIAIEEAVYIGLGLANITSMVNPEIIILGGSVGANANFLIPRIKETMKKWAQPTSGKSVEIVPSLLGIDAGLLGAAYGVLLRENQLIN